MGTTNGGSVPSGPEYDTPPIDISTVDLRNPASVPLILEYMLQEESSVMLNVLAEIEGYIDAGRYLQGAFIKGVTKNTSTHLRRISRLAGRTSGLLDVHIGNAATIDSNTALSIGKADESLPPEDLPPETLLVPPPEDDASTLDDGDVSIPPGEDPGTPPIYDPPPSTTPPPSGPYYPPLPPSSPSFSFACPATGSNPAVAATYGTYTVATICGYVATQWTHSGQVDYLWQRYKNLMGIGGYPDGVWNEWKFRADTGGASPQRWQELPTIPLNLNYSVAMPYNPYHNDNMSLWKDEAGIAFDNKYRSGYDWDTFSEGKSQYQDILEAAMPATPFVTYDNGDISNPPSGDIT